MRGLKLVSEACFYYLNTLKVSINGIVSEVYEKKKSGKLVCHVFRSNCVINFFCFTTAISPISLRYLSGKSQRHGDLSRRLKTIYDGVPIVAVLYVSAEGLQHRCFNKVNYVKVDAVFATNFHIQITETGETYLITYLFSHWWLRYLYTQEDFESWPCNFALNYQ